MGRSFPAINVGVRPMTDDPEDYEWSVVDRSQSPSWSREYRVVREGGIDFGTVRLDSEPESFKEVLTDEWGRKELR